MSEEVIPTVEELKQNSFVCLNPEVDLSDMSQDELEEFNKGVDEMFELAQKLLADDSLWKK